FYNYFPNYIYLNPTSGHDYSYGAGNQIFEYEESRVQRFGGEIQLKYEIFQNLSTQFLGEILQAKQLSGDKKGFTLPFSPPASALFNLTYSPKLNTKLSNTYFSVDYRITSKQENIVPPEKKTPGYQLMNIQIGTKISLFENPIQVSIQAQNLFDTKYLNHTSFYRLIELPEAGRNLILSVKIPFSK
ncbi:TonB-dependent receptor, partial [Pedobacter sp. MC2016-05]